MDDTVARADALRPSRAPWRGPSRAPKIFVVTVNVNVNVTEGAI
jgi:hypothetical protein